MKYISRLSGLTLGFFLPLFASAHVGYVVESEQFVTHTGGDASFLLSAFAEPKNTIIMIVTLAVVVLLADTYTRSRTLKDMAKNIFARARNYNIFLPWLARIAVGVALLGAGTAGVFISPIANASPFIATLEIYLGFFILAGFLLVPSLAVALCLYVIGLLQYPYLFGNLDFVGLILVLFSFGSGAPGVDDVLGVPFFNWFGLPKKWGLNALRILSGTAFMFLALYEKLLNPHLTELVVNNYHLTNYVHVSPAMWVFSAGAIEFIIGLCLFIGFRIRVVSAIALLVITLTYFFFKEAVYSHVTLFGMLSILFLTGGRHESPVLEKVKRVVRKVRRTKKA